MRETDLQSIKNRFGIIGNAPPLNHAIQVAAQVAATDMTVLITGESGSGKEMFSKIIHHLSIRKHNQLIAINCGAIPEGTIDSELFGHEKGSFTGALDARKGYFEVTDGGTIFLDEIGEMPLGTQARLLRVLENGEFIRVGSSKVQKSNVRVVAATNVDLIKAVEKGKFREDLYYRLNTVPINVPSLRERGTDIDLLFRKFATDFADKYKVKPIKLTAEAKEVLINYHFPGNIRQLKNLAEQISVLEMEREVDKETFISYLPSHPSNSLPALYNKEQKNEEGTSDRDLIYKFLFDMKKDLSELKQLVFEAFQKESHGREVIKQHKDLFTNMEKDFDDAENRTQKLLMGKNYDSSEDMEDHSRTIEITRTEDISYHDNDENLSLEEKEKEMIIKALRKNHNKRKYAAQDLGISERTLYRKIKQYEIGY